MTINSIRSSLEKRARQLPVGECLVVTAYLIDEAFPGEAKDTGYTPDQAEYMNTALIFAGHREMATAEDQIAAFESTNGVRLCRPLRDLWEPWGMVKVRPTGKESGDVIVVDISLEYPETVHALPVVCHCQAHHWLSGDPENRSPVVDFIEVQAEPLVCNQHSFRRYTGTCPLCGQEYVGIVEVEWR